MKNLLKKLAAASLFLFLTNVALADEVAPTKASAETSTQTEVEDPDLKLSIEELKKKYPIDWLEKKYGKVTEKKCDDGDDEPYLREVKSWPCGSSCEKYPQQKNCPKACSGIEPQNLVCTFFKEVYEEGKLTKGSWVKKPVAQFSDFSIGEIKSSFIHYFNTETYENGCDVFESDCYRIGNIAAITIISFLNKKDSELTAGDKILKSFLFSKKITHFKSEIIQSGHRSWKLDRCKYFVDDFLKPSVSEDKLQSFCSKFTN